MMVKARRMPLWMCQEVRVAHGETDLADEFLVLSWRSGCSTWSFEEAWEDSSSVDRAFSDALTASHKRPARR